MGSRGHAGTRGFPWVRAGTRVPWVETVLLVYFAMRFFCSTRYKIAELKELAACIHDQEGFFMLGRRFIIIGGNALTTSDF